MTYPAISKIGMHKITNETVLVTLTIFICLCVDMIFLPLLISMNFMEYSHTDSISMMHGKNTDFGDIWYLDVGY